MIRSLNENSEAFMTMICSDTIGQWLPIVVKVQRSTSVN